MHSGLIDTNGQALLTPHTSVPRHEFVDFDSMVREATQSVEQELRLEDAGWYTLGLGGYQVVNASERVDNVKASRIYWTRDPLAKQAVRIWTTYTFGTGMSASAADDKAQAVLENFWDASFNSKMLSASGQARTSDRLLVDGEIFPVLFLGTGGKAEIRSIDPLEITEIISSQDDIDHVLFYKREWVNAQGTQLTAFYRSSDNMLDEEGVTSTGQSVRKTEDGIVFHLAINTLGQRGNPLMLPAFDWLKQYRRFLAARVAIMLAMTRFAWDMEVKGGASAVNTNKGKLNEDDSPVGAGAFQVHNEGVKMTPIKVDSGARNAYDDARMLRLQVSSATGIPEQYFGDISSGNLATAKTVELPMLKMFQSMQQVWEDFYRSIDEAVFLHNKISPDKWYVDINWPPIAPKDITSMADALSKVVATFPQMGDSEEVMMVALNTLGIDDVSEVIDNMAKQAKSNGYAEVARGLRKIQKEFKEMDDGRKKEGN